MIDSVDKFIEEFLKHRHKVEWYLHKPTPLANATDIRGRDVLCSPVTVMVDPPIHHSLDYLDLNIDISPSFLDVVSHASSYSIEGLREAMDKFPASRERFAQALDLRERLLEVLGLEEEAPHT